MRRIRIPFLDLVTPHVELKEELTAVFTSALIMCGFIGGPMVEGFETGVRRISAMRSTASAWAAERTRCVSL